MHLSSTCMSFGSPQRTVTLAKASLVPSAVDKEVQSTKRLKACLQQQDTADFEALIFGKLAPRRTVISMS